MKLYINYNFCGYRWFMIDDIFQMAETDVVTLNECNSFSNVMIRKLMTYDSYGLAYMFDGDAYILAMRHIRETGHADFQGRKLSMAYIFEGEKNDKDLLDKIALTYISHKDDFDSVLTDMISSAIDDVQYDLRHLLEYLTSIKESPIREKMRFGKGKVRFLVSNWRDDTISDNLGLEINEFAKVKHGSKELEGKQFIDRPCMTEQIKRLETHDLISRLETNGGDKGSDNCYGGGSEDGGGCRGEILPSENVPSCGSFINDLLAFITHKMNFRTSGLKYRRHLLYGLMMFLSGLLIGCCIGYITKN